MDRESNNMYHGVEQVESYDTVIIGGGPAGLFCGIHCIGKKHSVLLLEKKESCGNKLLITGSGQCNLTHDGDISSFLSHYGKKGKFLKPALYQFSNNDLTGFFIRNGIPFSTEDKGKIFPVSRRSRDILECLLRESRCRGVIIHTGENVIRVRRESALFIITTSKNEYACNNLVLATGGMSYPATGSTGDGYVFAEQLGHTIEKPVPALTPVFIERFLFASLAGISFPDMEFSIWRSGKKIARCKGDVLFTHTGLSGPGILDNSRLISAGDEIRLSFAVTSGRASFTADFSDRIQSFAKKQVTSLLASYGLPSRLILVLLDHDNIARNTLCSEVTVAERTRLFTSLTGLSLTVESPGDYSVAMVTRGGVRLSEVNPKRMESRISTGLFFAGEILDIDGDTGGYNLQAAFSTGYLAGHSIRARPQL